MTEYNVLVLEDFSWQPPVEDKDLSTPPGSESKGDRYIVKATATGDWAGHATHIAMAKQANPSDPSHWIFITPVEGWQCWVKDENKYYKFDGSWGAIPAGDVLNDLNTVGQVGGDSQFLVGTEAGVFAYESGATVRTSLGLGNVSNVATDDTAYNATSWNANSDAATKNAIRDKVETMDSAIGLNTTHKSSNGSDHSIVGSNTTAIGLNTTHRGSDGSDHSIVGSNTTAIGLNTTHRSSDGSDHSIVGSNTTAIGLNTTHRGSNGSDHGFIDQAVTIASTPIFAGLALTKNSLVFNLKDTGGNSDFNTFSIKVDGDIVGFSSRNNAGGLRAVNSFVMNLDTGKIGISTSVPDAYLDVLGLSNYNTLKLTRSKSTFTQRVGILAQHYTAGQNSVALMLGYLPTAENRIMIGGGSSDFLTATKIEFYTAANTTTTGGTLRLQITNDDIRFNNPLKIREQASADADAAAYGQLWVKTATPNELWFTDDTGGDHQIAYI